MEWESNIIEIAARQQSKSSGKQDKRIQQTENDLNLGNFDSLYTNLQYTRIYGKICECWNDKHVN